ncbi:hypothetical protein C0584_01570 [Candidatus Parcubacteria bacterium]|nr:MAG: hypothetical protein C0584_01570 [Candidatus Parcubacteria bacterium]
MKLLSIVVCTIGKTETLQDSLEEILLQIRNSDVELVLVANNQKSFDLLKSFNFRDDNKLSIHFEEKIGLSFARNRGVKEASGEYVLFTDDDAFLSEGFIDELFKTLKSNKHDIVGGPIKPFFLTGKAKWFKEDYETLYFGEQGRNLKENEFLYGPNIIIKKEIINHIGGFDPSFGLRGEKIYLGEEIDIQIRARKKGYKVFYNPDLLVKHYIEKRKTSLSYVVLRRFQSAQSNFFLFSKDNCIVDTCFYLLRQGVIIVFRLLTFFFRDRNKWPHWQQYFIEEFLRRTEAFVWLFLCIKKSFRLDKIL